MPRRAGARQGVGALEIAGGRQGRERGFIPSAPTSLPRATSGGLWPLAARAALAAFSPAELGHKADPFAPAPAGIKPEWYFLFMFQTLKLIPAKLWIIDGEVLGILGFGFAGAVWVFLPFLDQQRWQWARTFIAGLAIFALAYIGSMTMYGSVAKWRGTMWNDRTLRFSRTALALCSALPAFAQPPAQAPVPADSLEVLLGEIRR